MRKNICPCCGKLDYEETSGEYDIPDESGAKQLSPDTGYCEACGFYYSQHINHSLEKQVKEYKKMKSEINNIMKMEINTPPLI